VRAHQRGTARKASTCRAELGLFGVSQKGGFSCGKPYPIPRNVARAGTRVVHLARVLIECRVAGGYPHDNLARASLVSRNALSMTEPHQFASDALPVAPGTTRIEARILSDNRRKPYVRHSPYDGGCDSGNDPALSHAAFRLAATTSENHPPRPVQTSAPRRGANGRSRPYSDVLLQEGARLGF
jgi:hypothetical protein